MTMRFDRYPRLTPRPITKSRLARAERALQSERNKTPLFAAEIAAEQPTPEQRIITIEKSTAEYHQKLRDMHAKNWRLSRRLLAALPVELRQELWEQWQRPCYPGSSEYLLDMIHCRLRELWGRDKADEWIDEHKRNMQ